MIINHHHHRHQHHYHQFHLYKYTWGSHKYIRNEKKALRETQTLRTGCSNAEPKIFAPPQTPFPGAQVGQNLISWRWSLSLPTNRVWWGSMHAISSYRGNRPTNTYTNTHKQTNPQTPLTIHCATKLSAQCNRSFL